MRQASSRTTLAGPLVALAFVLGASVALWASDALWTGGGADDSVVSLLWLVGWALLIPGVIVAGACAVLLIRRGLAHHQGWAWSAAVLVACGALTVYTVVAHLPWGSGSGSA